MFQKAAVIVVEELTGGTGGDKGGEGEGLVSAKRVPARTATERSRTKSFGGMAAE